MEWWYTKEHRWPSFFLLPLSWIFRGMVALRYFFYRIQLKKTVECSAPVIVVGNITVGGTGKTPLVLWLAHFLRERGYDPGIVTRGVGGKKHDFPCWVDANSDPTIVGDEAVLLAKRSASPVMVCIHRVAAVKALLKKTACDVIIADDGLQHYHLGRDIEIAIIDGERGLGNGRFLPAGPLRESPSRLKKVDFIVYHGKEQTDRLTMQLRGDWIHQVRDDDHRIEIKTIENQTVHAVAGIGNPDRFFSLLRQKGLHVMEHSFPDHHLFSANDFYGMDTYPIIMTEKDAVKCQTIANERFWYLPVEASVDKRLLQGLQPMLKKAITRRGKKQ